jgi:ribosome-interacting GTPase 1
MPANLTPQYLEAEKRYKQAATAEEKVEVLDEMLSVIPKHKGTEKLQADLKSKLKKLRAELAKGHSSGGRHEAQDVVKREGAGQVVLLGAPNAGKSSLLARLTKAAPEIADYPYTTRIPQPGMMRYENVQIQLVDLPPIDKEFWQPRLSGIIRSADAALLLADLSSPDLLEQVENVMSLVEGSRIRLVAEPGSEPATLGFVAKRTLLVGSKSDLDVNAESFKVLEELYRSRFAVFRLSVYDDPSLSLLESRMYEMLHIIRIYSKPPGKKVDLNDPFVLKKGSTVLEAAANLHKDFAERLKFARIWGSEKYEGQMVHRDHVLEDGDVVEFHI